MRLNVALIHGRSKYPEGHGKIEKFNQGVRARVVDSFDGAPDVAPDCGSLTLRLRHDLFEMYNHRPHDSLEKDTPYMRWTGSSQPLRPMESEAALREAFMLTEERTVSNDHCISYEGTVYEVPSGLAGQRVVVLRALLEDDAIYLEHKGRRVRLPPVDPVLNARSGRARRRTIEVEEAGPPAKTASTLSFEKEYGSILQPDGGFPAREDGEMINTNQEEDDE